MMNTEIQMKHEPTLVDQLIDALKNDCENKRGYDSANAYAYIAGYLGSMLQGIANSSPEIRKEIEATIESVKNRQ
jgi:hypothetical protein